MLVKRVIKNMDNIEDALVELHVQLMLKCLEGFDVNDDIIEELSSYFTKNCQ
ncbi:MAG: hypothetical protein OSJ65_00120 [Bacilli bacterium]|nr:hypothetical protein [Bacilli bacterium]